MRSRLVSLALTTVALTMLAAPASAPAQQQGGFAYSPGKQHYQLTTTVHRNQNQGGGRAAFEFDVTTTQNVTLDLARLSRDTMRVTITIDSIAVTSELAAPQPNLRNLFGFTMTGFASPQGRIYSFDPAPGTTDQQTVALYRAFKHFLVSFPTEPITVGKSWVDTTTETAKRDGFNVTASSVTASTVAGDTTVAGTRAWRISRHAQIQQNGDGEEAGKPIHLLGEGSVNGVHVVSSDGVYLGSESTQRFNIVLTNEASEGMPISQTIKSTVKRLPM
jgi:hypothetical protein